MKYHTLYVVKTYTCSTLLRCAGTLPLCLILGTCFIIIITTTEFGIPVIKQQQLNKYTFKALSYIKVLFKNTF